MSMENIIKEKTEEIVLKYKLAFKANGGEFSPLLEDILRQGISYGISFASIALASTPADITLKTEAENKLPSKDEYKDSLGPVKHILSSSEWSEPMFKCPKCGGGMCRNNMIICTSNPPKNKYKCDKCGYIDYL